MAVEIRSIFRKIDDLVETDPIGAYNEGIEAIRNSDSDREYDTSLNILEKLIDVSKSIGDTAEEEHFTSHIILRQLLVGKIEYAQKIDTSIVSEHPLPMTRFTRLILDNHDDARKGNFILESIERKSIFGNYEPIKHMPVLHFNSEDEAIKMLEDFFPDGRYIINLVQNTTALHHSVKIDIGKVQEVNVVENRRTIRLK